MPKDALHEELPVADRAHNTGFYADKSVRATLRVSSSHALNCAASAVLRDSSTGAS
jgi:hypothetical protein